MGYNEAGCGFVACYIRFLDLQGGYRGFYSKNLVPLTPKFVNNIHKRGGTILGTSQGGHVTKKVVDCIQDRGINQVSIRKMLEA